MTQFAKIVDHKHLVRDLYSKAVLNTDTTVVRKHEKRMRDLQKEEVRTAEINNLKTEMADIKKLLQALVSAKNIEV